MSGQKKDIEMSAQNRSTNPATDKSASEPPPYYNSEPSSQPPTYKTPTTQKSQSQSSRQHASVASINAVLASPEVVSPDVASRERKEKLPWRTRWKDWWKSWEIVDEDQRWQPDSGSQPKLNYWGARVDGKQTRERRFK
ncbi:unnamed protein product [Periconia digitata]|uniref:Uncharacterized protein n=1 Tax=Periconia digitata TaxID=1303443 RepID=A0A9W4XUN9_9PLEO|nr:unnamed protein product [Periconia digitata]